MPDIVLEKIQKSFAGKPVLRELSLVFPAGKISAIMAPSGCGKTTLLRILMGLEQPDSGQIHGLQERKKSAAFQEDRLCDWLTPVANIRLVTPSLPPESVLAAMRAVGLTDCEHQPCRELSGGMRRRTALLRALLADYDVLFLDEPFQGLDEDTKELVLRDTRERCGGRTVVLVTHDPREAEALGAAQTTLLALAP